MICCENVKAYDKLTKSSEKGRSCEDAQSSDDDWHEEEVDKSSVVKVFDDCPWINDGACDVEKCGNGKDGTREKVHDIPDDGRYSDDSEMQGSGLPHSCECEKG